MKLRETGNLHAGAVPHIVCYYYKSTEADEELATKSIPEFSSVGYGWCAVIATPLGFGPKDLEDLAIKRLAVSFQHVL